MISICHFFDAAVKINIRIPQKRRDGLVLRIHRYMSNRFPDSLKIDQQEPFLLPSDIG
jgi:hypothetical protein